MYYDLELIKSLNDEKLIQLVQNRNEAAFSELMSRYTPRIWRVIVANSRQRQDAEEILTDIWIAVWNNINGLKKVDSFGPWLQKIAYNACNRYYATSKRSRREIPYTDAELVEQIDQEASTRFRENMLRTEAREAVQYLPMRVRPVAALYYLESWSMKEISNELDLPIGTVKTKLRETRLLLRKEFGVESKRGGIMSSEFVQSQNQNDKNSDYKIIAAAVSGDCEATELIKDMVKPWIHNYIERYYNLGNDQEMKALELQAFEKVMNKLNKFLFVCPFHRWVRVLTKHTLIDHYREEHWRKKRAKSI
ncbi:MAG: sigma-70 family RNA polymerase sigma factor [Candidatus Poribacteria bacterium]|nr:sigma-70 family RNA polymerase sigma factor [Candidatus Poribacteria bacterium]